jgi:hypothetical protein
MLKTSNKKNLFFVQFLVNTNSYEKNSTLNFFFSKKIASHRFNLLKINKKSNNRQQLKFNPYEMPIKLLFSTKHELLFLFFNKIFFFKFFLYSFFSKGASCKFNYFYQILNYFNFTFVRNSDILINHNNFLPTKFFFLLIKKKIIQIFNHNKFDYLLTPLYNTILIRFLENISGKKIFLKFYSFVGNILNFDEKLTCII